MKYDFLIKQQKEALNAVETIIEECGKNCMSCGECAAYSDNPYNEGCIFKGIPGSSFISCVDRNMPIVEAAVILHRLCNSVNCDDCIFTTAQGRECIISGCPALWEKRLQLLKIKEEDK